MSDCEPIYGEIRWLAAHEVARQRREMGVTVSVRLEGVIQPISATEVRTLAKTVGVVNGFVVDRITDDLDLWAQLRALGKLPMVDLVLNPENYKSLSL